MRQLIGCLLIWLFAIVSIGRAGWLLIPMDNSQTNHLKAYGLTYWALQEPRRYKAEWLLNYRGGSFLIEDRPDVRRKARLMGVSYEPITDQQLARIKAMMEEENMDAVPLEKAPKIAVYMPPDDSPFRDPWDDAVKLALKYAEIPFDQIWDKEVLRGELQKYDWLHLHHEDFTGQFGKFYGAYRNTAWYQRRVRLFEKAAHEAGFPTVPKHKGAVALMIRDYVLTGGFLFAMCSATDTLDIALATNGGQVDIVPPEIDGTPIDPDYERKLDFSKTLMFTNFKIITDPYIYEFSDIDNPNPDRNPLSGAEDFELFEFSAKHDPIPTILTQNHVAKVHGFLGQTTSFNRKRLKKNVIILGDIPGSNYVKYIHVQVGKGMATFLGGHDPEDYIHLVGDPPTNLDLHKHSPGYRLILNNILLPAAKRKPQKT